jgi:ribosomal protein S18 acetylase RimI-like enzyme/quercetin dioxygenase-like cupin family protein
MKDFPNFMKNEKNHINSSQQNTVDIDGYYYEGKDGSQMAFWTCYSDRVSNVHMHDFDEYMVCVQGQYTVYMNNREFVLHSGDELLIPAGTEQSGKCIKGTRTIHAFGGKRIVLKHESLSDRITRPPESAKNKSMKSITFRSANLDDEEFFFLVRRETIKPLIEEYAAWDEEYERANISAKINEKQDKVIMLDGVCIGLLSVSEFEDAFYIEMLNIIEKYQDRGLGTWLLRSIIDEAKQKSKNIQLDTYLNNSRAIVFYLKNGFKIKEVMIKKYPKVIMEFKW